MAWQLVKKKNQPRFKDGVLIINDDVTYSLNEGSRPTINSSNLAEDKAHNELNNNMGKPQIKQQADGSSKNSKNLDDSVFKRPDIPAKYKGKGPKSAHVYQNHKKQTGNLQEQLPKRQLINAANKMEATLATPVSEINENTHINSFCNGASPKSKQNPKAGENGKRVLVKPTKKAKPEIQIMNQGDSPVSESGGMDELSPGKTTLFLPDIQPPNYSNDIAGISFGSLPPGGYISDIESPPPLNIPRKRKMNSTSSSAPKQYNKEDKNRKFMRIGQSIRLSIELSPGQSIELRNRPSNRQPIATSMEVPIEQPIAPPMEKPTEQPIASPMDVPIEQLMGQPIGPSTEQPYEQMVTEGRNGWISTQPKHIWGYNECANASAASLQAPSFTPQMNMESDPFNHAAFSNQSLMPNPVNYNEMKLPKPVPILHPSQTSLGKFGYHRTSTGEIIFLGHLSKSYPGWSTFDMTEPPPPRSPRAMIQSLDQTAAYHHPINYMDPNHNAASEIAENSAFAAFQFMQNTNYSQMNQSAFMTHRSSNQMPSAHVNYGHPMASAPSEAFRNMDGMDQMALRCARGHDPFDFDETVCADCGFDPTPPRCYSTEVPTTSPQQASNNVPELKQISPKNATWVSDEIIVKNIQSQRANNETFDLQLNLNKDRVQSTQTYFLRNHVDPYLHAHMNLQFNPYNEEEFVPLDLWNSFSISDHLDEVRKKD